MLSLKKLALDPGLVMMTDVRLLLRPLGPASAEPLGPGIFEGICKFASSGSFTTRIVDPVASL